jgi:hypothetical protein
LWLAFFEQQDLRSAASIERWRTRFEQDRLAGLEGRHQGSNPRTAMPAVQVRVARRMQQNPRRKHALVVP